MNIDTTENTNHYPRLFALIIGINKYQSKEDFINLHGAVPDGKAFQDYLIERLGVPKEQIKTLFDEKATRSAIIQAFRDFSENPCIEEGDPIFIFYAGHGSQKPPHPDWAHEETDAKMEVIVPYDGTSDQTPAPRNVQPIPDRTIAALLDEIAMKKGNNITVVFDCCHSASGTRSGGDSSSIRVRSVFLGDLALDKDTDRDICDRGYRATRPFLGSSRSGVRSHMLISACSSTELAVEEGGRGRLSTALLKLLKAVSPEKLRYCDILVNIEPIPGQSPQCEGHDQTRLLFNGKVVLAENLHRITFESETSEYILHAGAAHGVGIGAEFTVYSDADQMQRNPLGTLIVHELMDFEARMKPPPESVLSLGQPIPAISAVQTQPGELAEFRLYIPPDDRFYPRYHKIRQSNPNLQSITLVTKSGGAHLNIRTKSPGNLLIIELTDERVTRHGDNLFTDEAEPDSQNVSWILEKAARFYRELSRTSADHCITTAKNLKRIQVGLFELDPKISHYDSLEYQLTCKGENLCQDNVIDFVVKEGKPYGFRISNGTNKDLYVNAFFFDNTNFAILSHFNCPEGPHPVEAPLKKGSCLTLGYGRAGERPFTYRMRPHREIDVGFFKIYLSTKAFKLCDIIQGSALSRDRAAGGAWVPPTYETWDTIVIPVIQRRSPNSRYEIVPQGSNA